MKQFSWLLAGPAALVALALPCAAQTTAPKIIQTSESQPTSLFGRTHPRWCPTPMPSLGTPIVPVDPKDPKTPAVPPAPTSAADSLSGEGRYKSSYGAGSAVSAGFGFGAAVASASAGLPIPAKNATTATLTSNSTPLILPGLFSAASTQSVMPIDRVGFDYGYFSRFAIASPAGAVPGFNLNTFNVSVEKTVFNGLASVYVSVPLLSATQNISGQEINGLGDVSAGFKALLYENKDTGTALAAGFTVAAPTARPTISTSTLNMTFTGGTQPAVITNPPPVGTVLVSTETTSINPTYLQPWVGGLWVRDRFFVQEYFGVIVPTDQRVATMINNNLTLGYELYRDPSRCVSSLTPTFGVQALLPVTHLSNTAGSTQTVVATNIPCTTTVFPSDLPREFGFPDQVFLTGGAQIGLGERCLLSAGVVVPVVGPRGYAVGGVVGLTYFY